MLMVRFLFSVYHADGALFIRNKIVLPARHAMVAMIAAYMTCIFPQLAWLMSAHSLVNLCRLWLIDDGVIMP